jgi:hypothetical protein
MEESLAFLEGIGIGIAALAAFAAFRSAKASERAAQEARRASQADIVSRLLDQFSDPEMLNAAAGVREWDGAEIPMNSVLDRQRRFLSHYFQKVAALGQLELLDQDLVRAVVTKEQVALFCQIIEPMEGKVRPGYDRRAFDWLANLYGGRQLLPVLPARSTRTEQSQSPENGDGPA